jgi:hypothetical protein
MATVSTSQNINAVTYIAGEDITIDSGAVLLIDAQEPADVTKLSTNPGSIICTTSGKLSIVNTSTTTPIVLTLSANSKDFRFEKNGVMECRGAPIEIGTGNGSTQTFSFSSSPLNTISYPTYVEVETASGSGSYIPWVVVPTAGFTVNMATSDFGASESGHVLFWNGSTRQLSCGNGTNGTSIASGAKVRIPNIYLHSASNNATPGNRTLLDFSPTGTLDFEWVSCSEAIYFSMSGHGYTKMYNVGVSAGWTCSNTNSDVDIQGFSLCPDTQQTATSVGLTLSAIVGACTLKKISVLTAGLVTGNGKITISGITNVVEMSDLWLARKNGRSAAGDEIAAITFLTSSSSETVKISNLTCIGGRIEIGNLINSTFTNLKHCTRTDPTQETTLSDNMLVLANCQNIKFVGITNAGTSAFRNSLLSADGLCLGIFFYNVVYDGNNAATGFIDAANGSEIIFYNSTITNCRDTSVFLNSPTTSLQATNKLLNCRASLVSGSSSTDASKGHVHDLSPSGGATMNTSMAGADTYAFANLIDLGATPTTGSVVCGPFGAYSGLVLSEAVTAPQLDQAGGIEMPGSGNIAEIESLFSMHGVTSFQNTSPVYTYTDGGVLKTNSTTAPASMTFEFRLKNPGGSYGSYATMDGATLSGALAALSGYDSDVGFFMQIKMTTSSADTTRIINKFYLATNVDNTYVAPDASLNIRGVAVDDIVEMRLSSDDSLLYSFTGSGIKEFSASSYFEQDVYFIRKNASSVELMRTESSPISLDLGDNGNIDLFIGAEVQLAENSDVLLIKAAIDLYLDATISSRASQTTADKALTTTKFLGLK